MERRSVTSAPKVRAPIRVAPQVEGPKVMLAPVHGKVRRAGYCKTRQQLGEDLDGTLLLFGCYLHERRFEEHAPARIQNHARAARLALVISTALNSRKR